MSRGILEALADALPDGCVVTDPDRMESYRFDRAMFCPAGIPAAVVLPRETAQVSTTLRLASEYGVPVVPQGARSGLSGAANAIEGCVVLSLDRMDRVLEIDVANRVVVTQPGVFNAALSRAVAEHGLFYPPDPSSWEFCSIGGNLSTNSGGLCCVKYGVTTDYVLGLEVVLADGEVLRTGRRTVKGVAGYDLTKLFVGSEGTLGVITEATLMLRPAAQEPLTVAAVFADAATAAAAVSGIVTSGVVPSLLEFMDRTSLHAVNDMFGLGFEPDAGALVLAQSDAGPVQGRHDIDLIGKLLADAGATEVVVAEDAREGELLLAARRQVLIAFEKMGTTLIDDVCVPRDRLAELVSRIEAVAASAGVLVAVVGHAGDGNFHPAVVFDGSDEAQCTAAKQAFDDIMVVGLDLGGTITGEHGVGTLKKDLLLREAGELSLRVHRDLKRALDPQGILNPGKVFDLG
ncbi:MAG TPA: FAD-linked oxidase C-terminal domain-containing protein [Nocardioidaceae bacterium]|nr:FAD-linked oxidase C-terminal domain-containing protein [Nocardioidaceae bacterium]